MSQRATSKNLFEFGRRKKPADIHRKSLLGKRRASPEQKKKMLADISAEGFREGFSDRAKGMITMAPPHVRSDYQKVLGPRALQTYRKSYARGWAQKKKETTAKGPKGLGQERGGTDVVNDVASALAGQGLKKAEATKRARSLFKPGDTFDSLFRRAVAKKNPRSKMSASDALTYSVPGGIAARYFVDQAFNMKGQLRTVRVTGKATAKKSNPMKGKANPRIASLRQGKATAEVHKPLFGGAYKAIVKKGGQIVTESFKTLDSALAWARLKLFEVATAGNPVKNPLAEANRVYEEFHGLPSKEVVEYIEQEHHHSVTAALGRLVSLTVILENGKKALLEAPSPDGKSAVMVTTSEDGRQLFFKGGDQSINLGALGLNGEDKRDHMMLGEIERIVYRTTKTFERKGEEDVDFDHKFGGQGSRGTLPYLAYFPRNPSTKMKVFGGKYSIAPPRRDLKGVSPGVTG